MSIESDYEGAARELLIGHLRSDGLHPKLSNDGVATDIGKITIDFRVEGIEASGDQMQMTFWAIVGGVRGVEPVTGIGRTGVREVADLRDHRFEGRVAPAEALSW